MPVNLDVEIPLATAYSRARAGELALAQGESADLTSAAASCLKLAPMAANARYLLAWVDDRRIVKSESEFEYPYPPDMTVQVQDKSGPPTLRAGLMAVAATSAAFRPTSSRGASSSRASVPMRRGSNPASHMSDPPFTACGTTPTAPDWAIYCRATPWTVGATFHFQPTASGRPASRPHSAAGTHADPGTSRDVITSPWSGQLVVMFETGAGRTRSG